VPDEEPYLVDGQLDLRAEAESCIRHTKLGSTLVTILPFPSRVLPGDARQRAGGRYDATRAGPDSAAAQSSAISCGRESVASPVKVANQLGSFGAWPTIHVVTFL